MDEKNNSYENGDNVKLTKKDLIAIMIAQFEIMMPLIILLCGVMFAVFYLLMKFWIK